ncbi:MAG: molybdopterin-binding protein [Desulfovibrionaceae bacterium]
MTKVVPVREAVGSVLCHDMTRIVPDEFKGRAFKKGHVVQKDDIDLLLSMGKEHVYVLFLEPGQIHENEAAERIAKAVAGPGLRFAEVCEGRVNMVAERPGLFSVDVGMLTRVNTLDSVAVATLHGNQCVGKGQAVAGTRIVPLVIGEARIREVEAMCAAAPPVLQVKPFLPKQVGVVTTGSEIYHGRIEDAFGPVVRRKFADLGSTVLRQILVSDDRDRTAAAILELAAQGADMVVCTGGMSVDPDDQTPAAIRATGATVVTYGAPTFPGAMFMLAYLGGMPVLGLPGCVMYHKASIFDLVVPRIVAGERISREDIVAMGHGGFCAGCGTCRFPACPFGKGA